ncbi:Competence protein F phosphoribosyltransferase protein [Enhygromyxa salina]|uniref:Competence protein F phosphoribosyltransferase protein n=1 Tax=Enhygromyxa salina TaxID=215803 RepID=A0A0C2D8K6_9BACT|nr:Competence protein F phosphoribosyltransferase protein [Enhygromyxa salina]
MFPPICLGCERLLRHDDALALCSRCHPLQARLPDSVAEANGIRALWSYDGPLSRAVVRLKFSGALALAGPLGRLLVADPGVLDGCDRVVSVPLHWRRRLVRGFDQSEELSRWAVRHARQTLRSRAPVLARRVLARSRATRPQTQLDAPARAANVEGAFFVRRPEQVRGRRVLLIDDVTTTGATAQACMHALREAGVASVTALALLRAL